MNPLMNILGMPNPAEMPAMKFPGGPTEAPTGDLQGMLFAEFLQLIPAQSEINGNGEAVPLDLQMPEENPEETPLLAGLFMPEVTAEEPTAEQPVLEVEPEKPAAMPEISDEAITLLKMQGVKIETILPPETKVSGNVEELIPAEEDKLIPTDLLTSDEDMPIMAVQAVPPDNGKKQAVIDPLSLAVDPETYKAQATIEPIVTVEKGVEPIKLEVDRQTVAAIESLKEPLNIKEINVNTIIKPQQTDNSGPAKPVIGAESGELSMQLKNLNQDEDQSFDTNLKDNQKLYIKEVNNGTAKAAKDASETFRTFFETNTVDHKTDAGHSGSNAKADVDITVSQSTQNSPASDIPKTETQAVRFVVPNDLNDGKGLNNRSVMIKMEPEHLGPMRMTLSNAHDGLHARLVVDTAAAKTAVEGNLNHLMEQLGRQGIKVEFFDVSVGGSMVDGDSQDEQMTKFSQRFAKSRQGYSSGLSSESIATGRGGPRSYIGSAGVNCFA